MSRKLLSVLLAALLVVGFASFMTKADVTGSFSTFITIHPIDCSALSFAGLFSTVPGPNGPGKPVPQPFLCEQTIPKVDFESGLTVNWTVSGLTIGFNTVAGFTGIEHILTILKATLGALNITDQFFFAVPFGTDTLVIANKNQTDSEKVFTPICTSAVVKGVCPYDLLFVKKRVEVSISIAGITLSNLAEIGDFTFPQAVSSTPCGKLGNPCSKLPAQVASYTTASQTFAFGDALTISGQTVSGISVINTTGINLNTNFYEAFKKISFKGVLCQGVKEHITITGIPVTSGITASEDLLFNMGTGGLVGPGSLPLCNSFGGGQPFFVATTTVDIASAFGAIEFQFTNTVPTSATLISGASLSISSGALSITQTFNSLLQLSELSATLAATLNPDSKPASLTVTALICQDPVVANCTDGVAGLEELDWSLSVERSGLTFTVNANLTGSATVTLSKLEFVARATAGPVNLGADITILPAWKGVFNFGINF
jgi:hypothetical protein